jgi:sialate O-acetylesterase
MMKILHGLLSGQVLQRDTEGKGRALLSGECSASGDVELRVLKEGNVVSGNDWKSAGIAEGKKFEAKLIGLPAGGPYRVELRIGGDNSSVDDVFVGDVWILAGQSNMEGVGNLEHAPKPNELVRAFFMRDEWGIAEEPLHYLGEAVDIFHNEYGDGPDRPSADELAQRRAGFVKGMSPGHAFGLEMLERTGVPQGLVACAHGGTSMQQWSPSRRDKGGASLYGAMMRRFEKLGQPIAGLLWYQGESDAGPECTPRYTDRMLELIAATRHDMELPALPWIVVQLGCHAAPDGEYWNSIQEQQRQLVETVEHLDVAPAIDLPLDDGVHIGGDGHLILGRRLARLADKLVFNAPGAKGSLVVTKIRLVPTPGARAEAECTAIELTYSNVVGELGSDGRPTGFALLDHLDRDLHGIYRTMLGGNTVTLCTNLPDHRLSALKFSYGHGRHPHCSITDADGMSLPVIKAMPIDPEHAPFLHEWQAVHLPDIESIAEATFVKADVATEWREAHAREGFGILPKPADVDKTGVFALRTTLTATESLEAQLIFGSNAPFKIWLNGKLALEDSKAGVPLNPAQYRAKLELKAGKNDLLVAYDVRSAAPNYGITARVGTDDEKGDRRIAF